MFLVEVLEETNVGHPYFLFSRKRKCCHPDGWGALAKAHLSPTSLEKAYLYGDRRKGPNRFRSPVSRLVTNRCNFNRPSANKGVDRKNRFLLRF